jgi:hypothetical protein
MINILFFFLILLLLCIISYVAYINSTKKPDNKKQTTSFEVEHYVDIDELKKYDLKDVIYDRSVQERFMEDVRK